MPAQGYAKEGSQGKQRSHQARTHIYRMPELLAAKPWAFKSISQVHFLRQDSKHLAPTEERQNKFPQAEEGVSFQGRSGLLHVVFVKLRLGRLLFVPSKPAGTTGDDPHRPNRRDPRSPQTRPAAPRRAAYPEPAAPAAPRRPSKILPLTTSGLPTEAARRQDMAKGPSSLGESSGRARPRRREPAPPAASLRPIGLPAPPPGSPRFLALPVPARPRA